MSRLPGFLFLFLLSTGLSAQINRYMVFFADKESTPFSINQPEQFLSERAIERRQRFKIPVASTDLPVNPAYVQAVSDAGATVLFTTRWMNGVLCEANPGLVATLQQLPHVSSVELVASGGKPASPGRRARSSNGREEFAAELTGPQLSMLGIDEMHADQYRGSGVWIAVLDGGFSGVDTAVAFRHLFEEDRVITIRDFVTGSDQVYHRNSHGTEVFSVIAAKIDGMFTGGVYEGSFALYLTEDVASEYRVEEYNWLFAAEHADSTGVDLILSSLGYNTFSNPSMNYAPADLDGKTAVVTRAAQLAADRGIVVVVSAGNEGSSNWQLITPPADGVDVLAVGNITLGGLRAASSSKGPTADGRIKPDVVALGSSTIVVKANGSLGTSSGTSFSAPLVASLSAGIRQRYPEVPVKALLDAIRFSSSQGDVPDNFIGYGIPHYQAVVNYLTQNDYTVPVRVYPNPATDTLVVAMQGLERNHIIRIEVQDAQGRQMESKLFKFTWKDKGYVADLTAVPPGFYVLRVYSQEAVYVLKVIKQ